MMMMVLYFQVPNMESEPTTSDRLDKILELELTGAQDIIESLMLANSSYDHRIPTSTLGLQRWKQAMDLCFSGKLLFLM